MSARWSAEFATCAEVSCSTDAYVDLLHKAADHSGWVPLCRHHYEHAADGIEYLVEVHGFAPAVKSDE